MPKIHGLYEEPIKQVTQAIKNNDIVVVTAPSGYGKTNFLIPGVTDMLSSSGTRPHLYNPDSTSLLNELPIIEKGVLLIDEGGVTPQNQMIPDFREAVLVRSGQLDYKVAAFCAYGISSDDKRTQGSRDWHFKAWQEALTSLADKRKLYVQDFDQMFLPRDLAREYLEAWINHNGYRPNHDIVGFMANLIPPHMRILQGHFALAIEQNRNLFTREVIAKRYYQTSLTEFSGLATRDQVQEVRRKCSAELGYLHDLDPGSDPG